MLGNCIQRTSRKGEKMSQTIVRILITSPLLGALAMLIMEILDKKDEKKEQGPVENNEEILSQ